MKLSIVLLTIILFSTTLFAQPVDVRDTFTHKNAHNIHVSNSTLEYMITSDGRIMGRGTGVMGIDPTGLKNTTEWKQLLKNSVGLPMENVVSIDLNNNKLYILTSLGEVYELDAVSNIPKLINIDNLEEGEYVHRHNSNRGYKTWYTISNGGFNYDCNSQAYITSNNNLYVKHQGTNGSMSPYKTNFIKYSDNKYVDVRSLVVDLSPASHNDTKRNVIFKTLALDAEGKIHDISSSYGATNSTNQPLTDNKGSIIDGIKQIESIGDSTILMVNKIGTLSSFNAKDKTITNMLFYDRNSVIIDSPYVYSIVTDETCGGEIVVDTSAGIFRGTADKLVYNSTLTSLKPVTISPKGILTRGGILYTFGVSLNYGNIVKQTTQSWQSDNPIIPEFILANFNVDSNKVISRNTVFDLEFSLVSYKSPTALNIYYTKSYDINDKAKWNSIGTNIPLDNFEISDYTTGFSDNMGNTIDGKTYKYKWNIGDQDLTGIQIIVEPVY